MTNHTSIDYGAILSDLRAKRAEFDNAIAVLENLSSLGVLNQQVNKPSINISNEKPNSKFMDVSRLGIYEGAIAVLEKNNRKMKTSDIVEALINGGKKINSSNVYNNIATTLYKGAKRKDSRLVQVGSGEWGLMGW